MADTGVAVAIGGHPADVAVNTWPEAAVDGPGSRGSREPLSPSVSRVSTSAARAVGSGGFESGTRGRVAHEFILDLRPFQAGCRPKRLGEATDRLSRRA